MTGRVEWLAMQPEYCPRVGYARQGWRTLRVTVETEPDPFVGARPVVRATPIAVLAVLPGERALRPCGPEKTLHLSPGTEEDVLAEQVETLVAEMLAEPTTEVVA